MSDINIGRGFIYEYNFGIFEEGSADTNELFLASR